MIRNESAEVASHAAELTRSGLPLAAGLRAMSEDAPSRRLSRALREAGERLQRGEPVEAVFATDGSPLPSGLRHLVRAGLASGRLGELLEQHLAQVRRARELGSQAALSLVYPLLLLAVVAVLFVFYLMHLVPAFHEVFVEYGVERPWPTRLIESISETVIEYGVWIAAGLVALGVAAHLAITNLGGAALRRRLFCGIPVFGPAFRYSAFSTFCDALATLIEADVAFPAALRAAGEASGDADVHQSAARMARAVEEGIDPHQILDSARKRLPPHLASVFQWAHRRELFAEALRAAAESYAVRASIQADVMRQVTQPLAIVGVAVFVGLAVLATALPTVNLLNDLS